LISFRHHLVSLVAIFLALTVGIVLGGGPLSEVGRASDDTAATTHESDQTADEAAADAFGNKFATSIASRVLAGRLKGQTVVMLTMPGADAAVTKSLAGLVKTAGGTVVGRYDVQPALVDPNEKSLVDTLGSQLLTSLKNPDVPADATTYVRMGQLLGLGVATHTSGGAAVGDNATSVVESLLAAELMTTTATTTRGELVLVVLGDEPAADTGADVIVSGLLTGLKQASNGVVVAGSTASGESGLLSLLRVDEATAAAVSMTDSVQTGGGQVTAVLALAAAADDKVGSFGASGSDGPVPLG
jgi:Copper transport outer membrane protein, MctB